MNKWVGITLGAATAYGIVRYLQMQNVSDKTNITLVEPRIHDINLAGLYIRTEVQVNNQTINSVQITKPVVSLKSKGVLLSQSNAENKLIFIKPLGITTIDTIELRIGWLSLAGYPSTIFWFHPESEEKHSVHSGYMEPPTYLKLLAAARAIRPFSSLGMSLQLDEYRPTHTGP